MARYAETTSVPVDRSKAEIEAVLKRYGASEFLYGSKPGPAVVQFVCQDRMVRFTLPLPSEADKEFHQTERRKSRRSADAALKAWEQACRQRWRALLLAIKAKLEAVAAGIAQFEDEFLAYVVDPATNGTVGDLLRPQLEQRYLGQSTTLIGLPGPRQRFITKIAADGLLAGTDRLHFCGGWPTGFLVADCSRARIGYTVGVVGRLQGGVADCSRARIGYTWPSSPRSRPLVADCSRARIGYTAAMVDPTIRDVADCSRARIGYTRLIGARGRN